jgi:membrane protease YdiL (CAAX protease family)
MQSKVYKLFELFIIFIVIPASFAVHYSSVLKLCIGVIGFTYIIYVLLKVENLKFKTKPDLQWQFFWEQTILKLVVIAIITSLYVWHFDSDNLFYVISNNPLFWLFILFVYSFFSVYPQELIYRTFFFQRYESLFNSKALFIFINAILFSLAHLFFKNTLVLILTFLGGLLFALTYQKTKSTILVTIEHAVYGCWLFTVGMGNMLGFPS